MKTAPHLKQSNANSKIVTPSPQNLIDVTVRKTTFLIHIAVFLICFVCNFAVRADSKKFVDVDFSLRTIAWYCTTNTVTGYQSATLANQTITLQQDITCCEGCNLVPNYPGLSSTNTAQMRYGQIYTVEYDPDEHSYEDGKLELYPPSCYYLVILYPDDTVFQTIPDSEFGYRFLGSNNVPYKIYVTNDTGTVGFETCGGCSAQTDLPQLIADNASKATASVSGVSYDPNDPTTFLTWDFKDGKNRGCKIQSTNANEAIVTAGKEEGTVTVIATDYWGCVYEGKLELVCADSSDPSGGGGCGGGDCGSFGSGSFANHSVDAKWGLGKDSFNTDTGSGGYSAGLISLKASTPSTNLSTPQSLTARHPGPSTDWRWTTNGLRQVNTPQGLADIITSSDYKYSLNFYYASDVGGTTNGLYGLHSGAQAFVTWTVEFPGGADDTNHLQITETRSGASTTNLFTWVEANNGWILDTGNFLRRDTRVVVWNNATNRTETLLTYNSTNGSLVTVTTNIYQVYPWGEALTQQTFGQGSSAQTTTNILDADGVLQEVHHPNGSWEKYTYDGNKRLANKYASFLNQAPTTDSSLCRVMQYDYTPVGTGDDGTVKPWLPRKTVEKLKDQIVSLSYAVYNPNLDIQIRCALTNAAWNAADNLFTTNQYDSLDRLTNSVSPDGALQVFEYATNGAYTQLTNTVYAGQPNGGFTAVTDGTKTITVFGSLGETICRTNIDIASSVVLSSENYTYNDSLKRSYTVCYLDGTSNSVSYACCGIDTTTDRDGVVTQYTYDGLHRQIASTRLSITTSNVLDATGNVLATKRIGSDTSQITLRQAAYDFSRQMVAETNALNGVTTYTNIIDGSNQTIKTNTHPDGGTRIETYFTDGSLAKVTGSAVQPVRYVYDVESDGGVYRAYTKVIKLDASFADTSEWTKTYTDLLGRSYKTVYSDSAVSQSFYNNQGQLWKTVDPDSVTNLFGYNAKGEQEYTAIDLDNNGQINTNTIDRVTRTISDVVTNSAMSANVRRARTLVWATNNSSTSNLISTVETSVNGLKTWNTVWNNGAGMTNKAQTVYSTGGNRYVTNTAPDGSYSISAFSNGRLSSVTRKDSGNNQILKTTYGYDVHGRQSSVSDARNGTMSYTFNNADQIATLTTPAPGTGQPTQTSTSYYDNLGRSTGQLLPDNTTTTNLYHLTGLLKRTSGSRAYPVGYSYDPQGRMKTMTNWSGFAGNTGTRVTTWNYDAYRGVLSSKTYDGGAAGPSYTYTGAGRLATRTWARGTNTTYSYNNAGDLSGVDYSDSTPDVTYTYDRRGRQATVVCNSITTTLSYNDANQLLVETNSGGTLGGLALTNAYDTYLRRTAVALNTQPSTLNQFGYDNASRLSSVTNGLNTAAYTYVANSMLVSNIVFKTNGTTRMTTTKQYDYLNRLQSISSLNSQPSTISSFSYTYNDANQRTRSTLADGSYWVYGYDALGQVKSGKRYWADGTLVPGQQFEYGFDDIGNRTSTKAGGDATGSSLSLRSASYTANNLNQYTSRDVPNAFDVLGASHATNTVTVNGSAADYRRGEYFQELITVVNSSTSVWQTVSVTNSGGGSTTGSVFVAKTPEAFTYDQDGNLTNDGRWTLTWDGENRLTQALSLSSGPTASKRKVIWEYDGKGRRIRHTAYDGSSGSYVVTEDLKFLSDGWRHLAELNATNNTLIRSYAWGLDLGGSLDGAGGVGGLLILNSVANGVHFYAYDDNGNVTALVKASDGAVSANYEYDPFGQIVRVTGTMATENRFRFSTKRSDNTTDFVLYEYRIYVPSTGKWLSRDPIEERGGMNLYGFVRNDALDYVDTDGRGIFKLPPVEIPWPNIPPFSPPKLRLRPHSRRASTPCTCYGKMTKAKEMTFDWLAANQDSYDCQVNGKHVELTDFPGVVDGTKSTWGVPHCITGYFAAKLGASPICLMVGNFGHEAWEVLNLGEWKDGLGNWSIDTVDDMAALLTGAQLDSLTDCIPVECKKKAGK